LGSPATAVAQVEVTMVLPGAGQRQSAVFDLELGRSAQPPPDHHATVIATLNELSPVNLQPFEWSRVKVKIVSPWGHFPPYELGARVLNPPAPGSGDLAPSDVGVGVFKVTANNAIVNPLFDYDPTTVGKNIDGEPLFQGTLDDLSATLPGTPFYETNKRHPGQVQQVWLDFAVGPQFYTPGATASITIELYVSRL
jgi:hypothetical protein